MGARHERATLWVAGGAALNGLGALGFQIVGTRALGAANYAQISVLWTLQFLWVAIVVAAVEAYVTRLVTTGGLYDADLARFQRLFARLLVLIALACVGVGVALAPVLFGGYRQLGVVLGLLVLGFGWFGLVRGRAAGLLHFRTYSIATVGESAARLVAAFLVVPVFATPVALAWVLPIGPLLVGVIFWLRRAGEAQGHVEPNNDPETQVTTGAGRRFLTSISTANAAVQFLLAGGPLVLVPLGAEPASIAVFFTTVTTARVPMTFALNGGLTRVLPPLTRLALVGDTNSFRRVFTRTVVGIFGTTLLGAVAAFALGPTLLEVVYGTEFRPTRGFVTLVASSTVLAVGGLLLGQFYISVGREGVLPMVWLPAVVLAGVLVLLLPGQPVMRVAVAFAIAIAVAVVALGGIALIRGGLRPCR